MTQPAGEARLDRATEILGHAAHPLDAVFAPRSVAVIGATESAGKVGRTLLGMSTLTAEPRSFRMMRGRNAANPCRGAITVRVSLR